MTDLNTIRRQIDNYDHASASELCSCGARVNYTGPHTRWWIEEWRRTHPCVDRVESTDGYPS